MQPIRGLSLIAAMTPDRVIGSGGKLPWRLPSDLKRFKRLTTDHPSIMGRKTWESIPDKFRPLVDRTNIVVTRQPGYQARGATVVSSLEAALAKASGVSDGEIFICGGGELYREAIPLVTQMYITWVYASIHGDTLFPETPCYNWVVVESPGKRLCRPDDQYMTSFQHLRRVNG
jgi:dihydrofolate reductase